MCFGQPSGHHAATCLPFGHVFAWTPEQFVWTGRKEKEEKPKAKPGDLGQSRAVGRAIGGQEALLDEVCRESQEEAIHLRDPLKFRRQAAKVWCSPQSPAALGPLQFLTHRSCEHHPWSFDNFPRPIPGKNGGSTAQSLGFPLNKAQAQACAAPRARGEGRDGDVGKRASLGKGL